MLKCPKCGTYTMKEVCPRCGDKTVTVHPARFSPDDRYARLRSPMAYEKAS
jgi:H/ACA ribonucleoprotein complex subunit 3